MSREQLKINGVEQAFDGGLPPTLADLLVRLGLDAATVVAEVDGRIVPRAEFAATPVRQGQRIELVRFVGGG